MEARFLGSAHTQELNNDLMSEIHESEERKATATSPRKGKGSKGGKADDNILKNTDEVRKQSVV